MEHQSKNIHGYSITKHRRETLDQMPFMSLASALVLIRNVVDKFVVSHRKDSDCISFQT